MDINIKTKYNIGDLVYTAGLYHELYPISNPYIIKNILVNGNINKICINYEIEQNRCIERISESWLFPTYAECTKWCEEHNKI